MCVYVHAFVCVCVHAHTCACIRICEFCMHVFIVCTVYVYIYERTYIYA